MSIQYIKKDDGPNSQFWINKICPICHKALGNKYIRYTKDDVRLRKHLRCALKDQDLRKQIDIMDLIDRFYSVESSTMMPINLK